MAVKQPLSPAGGANRLPPLNKIIKIIDKAPTDYNSFVKVYSLGAAVSEVKKRKTAFYYRKAKYVMAISSSWEENDQAPINKSWVAAGFKYLKELTCGSYINFPYSKLKDYNIAYYGQYIKYLNKIKSKYDPCNVFSFPQSIKPIKRRLNKRIYSLIRSTWSSWQCCIGRIIK